MDAYCTIDDVTDRLTIEPDKDDERLIVAMVEEATVAVDAYLGKHFDRSVPAAVRVVCARVAARAVSRGLSSAPVGAESQSFTAGPFSTNQNFGSNSNAGGVFLTAEDKRRLRSVGGGRRGAFTVSLY